MKCLNNIFFSVNKMKMMTKEKAAFVKKMQKAKEDKLELPKR